MLKSVKLLLYWRAKFHFESEVSASKAMEEYRGRQLYWHFSSFVVFIAYMCHSSRHCLTLIEFFVSLKCFGERMCGCGAFCEAFRVVSTTS